MSGARERTTTTMVILALGALGSLVVHQLAYALVSRAGTGHGHLSVQWAIVTPIAVLLAVATVIGQVRQLGVQCPTTGFRLGLVSGVMFMAQELVEATHAGASVASFATSQSTIVGLLFAPLVGMTIAGLLRRAAEVAAFFVAMPEFVPGVPKAVWTRIARATVSRVAGCVAVPRGPPRTLLPQ